MDAEMRAHRLKMLDEYRRTFEHANTGLSIAVMGLSQQQAMPARIVSFTDAALSFVNVCEHELSRQNPLDVLFWLRDRLVSEGAKPGRDDVFIAQCNREVRGVETLIQDACAELGDGKVVALL
jgi:hypothetical protein